MPPDMGDLLRLACFTATVCLPALGLSTSYTYDANKNLTSETLAPDNAAHVMRPFSFTADQDDEDRLIDWERGAAGGGETRDWVLTLVGDWDQFTKDPDGAGGLPADVQDRNHTDAHEINDVDGVGADHDAKGNMTDDAGAGGNAGGGNPREFTWDFDNQLASVEMPDGKVHAYTYDALGRRVSQKIDTGTMGGGPYETTVYVCSTHPSGLAQVVAEYDAGDAANSPQRHYVYGTYVDEPLVMRQISGTAATYYYHRNRKYDIVGLTSATGIVSERYAYTPYGEVTFLNGLGVVQVPHASPLGNPYLFTGQRYDAAPAVHFFKGRYYDAGLGRFLNRDPLGYVDGMSLYAGYFGTGFANDPAGLWKYPWEEGANLDPRDSPITKWAVSKAIGGIAIGASARSEVIEGLGEAAEVAAPLVLPAVVHGNAAAEAIAEKAERVLDSEVTRAKQRLDVIATHTLDGTNQLGVGVGETLIHYELGEGSNPSTETGYVGRIAGRTVGFGVTAVEFYVGPQLALGGAGVTVTTAGTTSVVSVPATVAGVLITVHAINNVNNMWNWSRVEMSSGSGGSSSSSGGSGGSAGTPPAGNTPPAPTPPAPRKVTQAEKKGLAKDIGGIPRSSQPTSQGRFGQGTKWWEYIDSQGNRKIIVEHPDGSVHVGRPKPQSQHLDGTGPPKYYPEPGSGHVGE